jgi:hypothetical protein
MFPLTAPVPNMKLVNRIILPALEQSCLYALAVEATQRILKED